MPEPVPVRELCAAGARRVGEPLYATASRVDLWFALEVRGPWPNEVGESLDPNTPAGRALRPLLQAVPRSRVLFIKGAANVPRETFAFYVAVTDEAQSRLYHFELESYAALEKLDLFGVLADDERYAAHREPRPLFLVCTHGTHDRCCAKFGFPTYRELEHREPERVWQCSHVGGDRFAANIVVLPYGLYYGHVDPGDASAILDGADRGHLHLPRLRGRACYPAAVQAAEYLLREGQHETALDAYHLWSHRRQGEVTEAAFLATGHDQLHLVRVEPTPLGGLRFTTCHAAEEKPVVGYRLVEYRAQPFQPEVRLAGSFSYHLRPAAMRDYGFIYRLRRDTLRAYLDALAMPAEEQAPFCARFDVTRHRILTIDGGAAGAISTVEREGELNLANLHLLPIYQRRGLGTLLVHQVQARATAAGRPLTTQVLKTNPALAFYERLGFRIRDEQGLRYRLIWEP